MNEKGATVTTQPVLAAKCGVQVQAFRQNFLKTPFLRARMIFSRMFSVQPARNAGDVHIPEARNSQDVLEARMA